MVISLTTLFLCLLLSCLVIADSYNVTVNDRDKMIIYGEGWFDSGLGMCGGCETFSAFQNANNGTWKRSTYDSSMALDKPKSASMTFRGTAVYVNCILAPATAAHIPGNTDLTFILDGIQIGQMLLPAQPGLPQSKLVFQQDRLSMDKHTLSIVNGHVGGAFDQVMVFLDSIVYTADSDDPSDKDGDSGKGSKNNKNKAFMPATQQPITDESKKEVIIAAVCGVLGGILLLAILIWLYHRFKAKRASKLPVTSFPTYRSSWNEDGFSRPPTDAASWHPSMFVRQYSKAPLSRRAPSITSSRRHILSRSSDDSNWRDMSVQDTTSEPDTSEASKSVHPGSLRQYENPYGRRDPFIAVQQWQQRQSRVSSMESEHYVVQAADRRPIGLPRSPSVLIQPPPLSH